ncbi:hypothetical protein QE152_g18961 [Popillia japonica]|uniref:Uncharacterized protein n=1 Tax=Popillia japonica TaxID=7064 RepID=A0AAW1L1V8_POPJA
MHIPKLYGMNSGHTLQRRNKRRKSSGVRSLHIPMGQEVTHRNINLSPTAWRKRRKIRSARTEDKDKRAKERRVRSNKDWKKRAKERRVRSNKDWKKRPLSAVVANRFSF